MRRVICFQNRGHNGQGCHRSHVYRGHGHNRCGQELRQSCSRQQQADRHGLGWAGSGRPGQVWADGGQPEPIWAGGGRPGLSWACHGWPTRIPACGRSNDTKMNHALFVTTSWLIQCSAMMLQLLFRVEDMVNLVSFLMMQQYVPQPRHSQLL